VFAEDVSLLTTACVRHGAWLMEGRVGYEAENRRIRGRFADPAQRATSFGRASRSALAQVVEYPTMDVRGLLSSARHRRDLTQAGELF
jgi:hypothetical protein